jgi:protein phosphatase
VQLSVAAGTDVGRVRSGNEDNLHAEADQDRGIFIVADGMGGHAAGEIASEMAVQTVARELAPLRDLESAETRTRVMEAIRKANDAIYKRTITESEKQGMGTTVSALVLARSRYMIGQVGDSRIYLLRGGTLTQLTKDHSYVQEQVDAGFLTPEQARYHPYSNVITRCVGANASVEPDVLTGDVEPGDVFLLASDGLTGMVDDAGLLQLMTQKSTPIKMVDAMITAANRKGGLDNITAIVVQVLALGTLPAAGSTGSASAPANSPKPTGA